MTEENTENSKARKITLSVSSEFYDKIMKKTKKQCFESVQQYIYSVIRRDVFRKRSGGRPNEIFGHAVIMGKKKIFTTKGKPYKF